MMFSIFDIEYEAHEHHANANRFSMRVLSTRKIACIVSHAFASRSLVFSTPQDAARPITVPIMQ